MCNGTLYLRRCARCHDAIHCEKCTNKHTLKCERKAPSKTTEKTSDSVIATIQKYWSKHHISFADQCCDSDQDGLDALIKIFAGIKFTDLRRTRSIVGRHHRNIFRLHLQCTINLVSIQSDYDQCPYLHLLLQTKNYHQNQEINALINTQSSNIYTVLLNECCLFDSIILLIIEYCSHEDNYSLLSKNGNGEYEFEHEEEYEDVITRLDQYVGVSDYQMIGMVMQGIGFVFDRYAVKK